MDRFKPGRFAFRASLTVIVLVTLASSGFAQSKGIVIAD